MKKHLLISIISISLMSFQCEEESPCMDPDKINEKAVCHYVYAPVCGCDGITYPNDCFAGASGVLRWETGICGD